MKFRRPSTGTILGGLALFVALGGTAAAATGTLVNIADPSNSTHVAHVDSAGRLQVGNTSGSLNVQEAPVFDFFHASSLQEQEFTCEVIATASTPVVVRQVRVDVVSATAGFGENNTIKIYGDKTCTTQIATVNPPSYGQTVIPFDPGYAIANGSGLSAMSSGTEDDFYTDGYRY